MSREPLIGYNHNLRYKDRVFHVQTEDSGLAAPHVRSHVFFGGTVLSSSSTDYTELADQPDHVDAVTRIMRDQHKQLMRRLLHGDLDGKIVSLLGSLEPAPEAAAARIRRYHHRYQHAGRIYEVQTSFFATVTSDVFWDAVLVATQHDDCRSHAKAGSPVVERLAQEQHKRMIRKLRDGALDDAIVALLGSLEPPRAARSESGLRALCTMVQGLPGHGERAAEERTLERYHHRVRHGERLFDLTTNLYTSGVPHAVTELRDGETLLTRQRAEKRGGVGTLRQLAQEQHKRLLRQLRDGEMDETIALLDELAALEG